jgi:DNA-binding HxlR family transcriptional regulator
MASPTATLRPGAPPALAWRTDNCTVLRAVEIVGDPRAFAVLREVFLGVRRFADIQEHTGMPRQVLTGRLERLVDEGLLRRVPYQEPGSRVREEYRLTDKGLDLYPVLVALADWGNRYAADRIGPPVRFEHRDCGAEAHAVLRCDDGHEIDSVRDVVVALGPGARKRTRTR